MVQLISKKTFGLRFLLWAIIVLPWVSYYVFSNKAVPGVHFKPEGGNKLLSPPMTYYLLMSKEDTAQWIDRHACEAINASFLDVDAKYSLGNLPNYFSYPSWEQFVDFQQTDQMVRIIKQGGLTRTCAPLLDTAVFKTINYEGHIYSFFQTKVVATLRSRTAQQSVKYFITGAVKSTVRPSEEGNILQFIQFSQSRSN